MLLQYNEEMRHTKRLLPYTFMIVSACLYIYNTMLIFKVRN
jgi:hypothetical protein